MINSTRDITANINMNRNRLEEVNSFKYLGTTMTKDVRCTAEIRIRITTATAAMVRLDRVWKSSNISFLTKYRLFKSLVIAILLYGCESWTMLADAERKIYAFENKCHRRLLRTSYKDRISNEFVRDQITTLVGHQEPLLATVKRRKLAWYGHTVCHDCLSKTILQGTLERIRRRGRPRKS